MIFLGTPLLPAELNWMIVGEKLSEGFTMYKDVWAPVEPLSAGVYYFIDSLFGRSPIAYQSTSLILVFIQAIVFNLILQSSNAYSEKSLIPAILYLLFSTLFFDFNTLSPVVMGTTFLLFAVNLIFLQIKIKENAESMFYSGLMIGIASLFHMPLIFFLLMALVCSILFIRSKPRLYFTLIIGFLFPFLIIGVYYAWKNGYSSFYSNLIHPFFNSYLHIPVESKVYFLALSTPFILSFLSILLVLSSSKYVNVQYIFFRIMGLWLVSGLISMFFTQHLYPFQFFILVPAFAYFSSHFFLLIRKKMVVEITFVVVAFTVAFINYGTLYKIAFKKNPVSIAGMIIHEYPEAEMLKGKKVLVLGKDKSPYLHSKLATPYLDWNLSLRHFAHLDNYYNVSELYENFSKDPPQIIIDKEGVMDNINYRVPAIANMYEKMDEETYVKK